MRSAYVLAVVGESPAVISELIWWLVCEEGFSLAGIEVWGTSGGAARLRELVEGASWSRLLQLTGPLPPLWPEGSPPCAHHGFRIHVHRSCSRPLDDVRTYEETSVVNADLHDRMLELRSALPDHAVVIGSLAGGRKTTSAALQSAFSLQARASDRLVHLVLDDSLERVLRSDRRLSEFAFPEATWESEYGVPVEEQVVAYDVMFPRVRCMASEDLQTSLLSKPWLEAWPVLESNLLGAHRGALRREGKGWLLQIVDDEGHAVHSVKLPMRLGALFAAMCDAPAGSSQSDLISILDERDLGWAPPVGVGHDDETRGAQVRGAMAQLRKQLQGMPPGLAHFRPSKGQVCMTLVDVEL